MKSTLPADLKPQIVYELNDAHFHLTNYVQEGIDITKCLENMGTRVGRVALFGIPLQQLWSYGNSGDFAPTYYLASDDPLYYYSFTDAFIAMAFRSLPVDQQARFDPMITGFDPADMYAADHIKRVLKTFPGVFTGIGEFSIHKEFVSSKVAGPVASINNPAVDRIMEFCAETGLLVILHNMQKIFRGPINFERAGKRRSHPQVYRRLSNFHGPARRRAGTFVPSTRSFADGRVCRAACIRRSSAHDRRSARFSASGAGVPARWRAAQPARCVEGRIVRFASSTRYRLH